MGTPHVDLSTGKIYNCRKGSYYFWHEKGHLKFNDTHSELLLWKQYAFTFWMISATLSVVNKFMLGLSIPLLLIYIGAEVFEEWWANRYAKVRSNK